MTEKLSKLHHDGHITDEEYDRLKKALNSLRVVEESRKEISDKMVYPGYDIAISFGMKMALDILNDKIKEYAK